MDSPYSVGMPRAVPVGRERRD